MKLLLDTHILLWAAENSEHLSSEFLEMLMVPENELFFSAASLWEITIKNSLGRDDFNVDARILCRALLDNDYQEVPITGDHCIMVGNLPPIHKDPFDRILIAQATFEGALLLTADQAVAQYPGPIQLM